MKRAEEYNTRLDWGEDIAKNIKQMTTSFDEMAARYLDSKKAECSPKTVQRYSTINDHFSKFLKGKPGIRSIADVTHSLAADYKTHRQNQPVMPNGKKPLKDKTKQGVSTGTMEMELQYLRGLFKEAKRRGYIDLNPFEEVKVSRSKRVAKKPSHRVLSEDEIVRFLNAAREYDSELKAKGKVKVRGGFYSVFFTYLKTGMRRDELRYLEWEDIDFDNGYIHIRPKKVIERRQVKVSKRIINELLKLCKGRHSNAKLFRSEKQLKRFPFRLPIKRKDDLLNLRVADIDAEQQLITSRQQLDWKPKASAGRVPITPKLDELLRPLRDGSTSNFVFEHPDGGCWKCRPRDELIRIVNLAGIKNFTRVHDLRHTCAAQLRRNGVPLETIMGILRHASIEETLIYAPYDEEEGRKAIRKLDFF